MRILIRFLIFGGIVFGGWKYYWSSLHCLDYDRMGVCLKRCEIWQGWECVKVREKKKQVSKNLF